MGLKAKWTCTCDFCGKVNEVELTPEQEQGSSYYDIWGPGWPEGWLQCHEDDKFIFHCSSQCVKDDLRKQGKLEELKRFENTVWVA